MKEDCRTRVVVKLKAYRTTNREMREHGGAQPLRKRGAAIRDFGFQVSSRETHAPLLEQRGGRVKPRGQKRNLPVPHKRP